MLRPTVIGQDTVDPAAAALRLPATSAGRSVHDFPSSPCGQTHPDMTQDDEFVGREPELGVLAALLAQVRTNGARVTLIRGAAGIGKTALVREFLRRHPDVTVVRGSGDEGEAAVSYALVDQLFSAVGLRSAALLAHIDRVLPVEEPVVVGRQVLAVLSRYGARGPTCVVIDDAHRADVDSLRALLFALRRLAADPVLTMLVVPSDDFRLPAGLERLAEGHTGVVLEVGPLTPSDVQALATAVTGSRVPGLTAHRLCAHTLGNPRHLLALLAETPPDRWRCCGSVLPAPRVYSRIIGRRLSSCSDETRLLVEAAAVLGDTTALATAAALARLVEPLDALEEACFAGLLAESGSGPPGLLAFPHPLVRAAVYGQLTPGRRCRLHQEAARLVDDGLVALHHRAAAARPPDEALAAELQRSSDRARSDGAWAEAAWALLESGRLSVRREQREERVLRAVALLGDAGAVAGTAVPDLASATDGPLRDVTAGYIALLQGRSAEAHSSLTRAWAKRDAAGSEVAALTAQRLALHAVGRLHRAEVVEWARRAMELAGPDDPVGVEARALLDLGLDRQGSTQEFARADSVWIATWSYVWSACAGFVAGEWDEAAAAAERAVSLLEESGHEWLRPLARMAAASVPAARGEWAVAEEHARSAVARPGDYELMMVSAGVARASVPAARGDHVGVLRALEPVVALTGREGMGEPDLWPWQDLYAEALVSAGHLADAEVFLVPRERAAAARGHASMVGRLARVRGRLEGARGRLSVAEEAFGRADAVGEQLPFERGLSQLAHGQVLRRAGQRRAAAELLSAARERFAGLRARPYLERCEQELAACGLAPAKRREFDPSRLTAQELAVARLVAVGMSNRHVASELFISIKTVQFHLTHIYAKLGVGSRAELAAQFRDHETADHRGNGG
jgi:DNA-binding CsgD family transcriptional regulator